MSGFVQQRSEVSQGFEVGKLCRRTFPSIKKETPVKAGVVEAKNFQSGKVPEKFGTRSHLFFRFAMSETTS